MHACMHAYDDNTSLLQPGRAQRGIDINLLDVIHNIYNPGSFAIEARNSVPSSLRAVMEGFPEHYIYRRQLLKVSDNLEVRDVERLCYLCRGVVPRDRAEEVREGTQLFDILEEHNYISPHNLEFLGMCLRDIGRERLIEELPGDEATTCNPLPCMPNSLQATKQMIVVFRRKAHWSIGTLAKIQLTNSIEMENICGEVHLAITAEQAKDLPISLWQPGERCKVSIDEVVTTTLKSLFLYTKSQLEAIQISCAQNIHKLKKPSKECTEQMKVLEEMLDKIEWNSKIRERVKAKALQTQEGQQACKNIREICTDLLRTEELDDNIQSIEDHLSALCSTRNSLWQVPLTYLWLINLLHLAKTSALDLTKHREVIWNLLIREKESIASNYDTLLLFVGKDTLEKLEITPQSQNTFTESHLNTVLVMGWPISRQIFLIQFASLAMGYSIDPMEIWRKYAKHASCEDMVQQRIQTYVTLAKNAENQMLHKMECLRQRAIDIGDGDLRELFPDVLNK